MLQKVFFGCGQLNPSHWKVRNMVQHPFRSNRKELIHFILAIFCSFINVFISLEVRKRFMNERQLVKARKLMYIVSRGLSTAAAPKAGMQPPVALAPFQTY